MLAARATRLKRHTKGRAKLVNETDLVERLPRTQFEGLVERVRADPQGRRPRPRYPSIPFTDRASRKLHSMHLCFTLQWRRVRGGPAGPRIVGASGIALAWCLVFTPGPAAAQDTVEPIRLTYQASAGCPDEGGFWARVRAQTVPLHPSTAQEAAPAVQVVLDAGPPATGRVAIMRSGQPSGTRSLQGDNCADVADAIALVVALAIDPRVRSSHDGVALGPYPALAGPSLFPSSPSRASRSSALVAQEVPAAPSTTRIEDRRATGVATGSLGRHAAYAGADFVVAGGASPNALVTGSPYLGWRANRSAWFDPSLRLAFLRAGTGAVDVPAGGTATFVLTVGQLDACPVAWSGAAVRATACARLEAGALDAAGGSVAGAERSLRPWIAAGPMARAEWLLAPPFFLGAEAGALFRVIQDTFEFRPNIQVYRVPAVGLSAGAGLGVDFL